MFEVKVDGVDGLLSKLRKFSAQIDELHKAMPQEMEAWQREDMRRRYPNTTVQAVGDETSATTAIWPRSRMPSRDQHQRRQGPRQFRPAKRGPVARSNRPILRAELLERLWGRMLALTSEAMKWP